MRPFWKKKVDPKLAGLCNNFQFHMMEATDELNKKESQHSIPCLGTGMKVAEHMVERIEGDELTANEKRYYVAVLNRIIDSVPENWSMDTLFVAYIVGFLSVAEGKSLDQWLQANKKKLEAAKASMKLKAMLLDPINAQGSFIESLNPDLKKSVLKILSRPS